jgi:hypothetical protein
MEAPLGVIGTALALAAAPAAADLVIGNIDAPVVSSTVFGGGSTTTFKAAGFTMGAQAYFLDSVSLSLNMGLGEGNPLVSIWSGSAAAPTTQLFVLNNPASLAGGGTGHFEFTAGSSFTLEANTTYWLHVASDPIDGADFNWLSTDSLNPPSGPAASFNGYNFNGAPSSFYNLFQLNGTAVPAPSGVAALGLMGLAAARRRR